MRRHMYVMLLGLLVLKTPSSFASDELPPENLAPKGLERDLNTMLSTLEETSEQLANDNLAPEITQALKDAEDEYRQVVHEHSERGALNKGGTAQKSTEPKLPSLELLASEVDELKNKLVVEKAALLARQSPTKVKVTGAKTIFNYLDTAVYEITSAVDHVTDIQLKPGEVLTTAPTSGDTVRWSIGVMKSGALPEETTHLIVKPLDDRIQTNLIIATNQHVYQLRLKSGAFHMPVVAWNYPEDSARALQAAVQREASQEPTVAPEQLRFGYAIEPEDKYPWTPVRVFDDGNKTFIQMPKAMKTSDAPALFLLEDDSEPLLTNYRIKGDYYIVDRLLERAELRVGASKKVTIELEKPSWFERNF